MFQSVDSLLSPGEWLAADLQYVSQYGGKRAGWRVKPCQRQIFGYSLEKVIRIHRIVFFFFFFKCRWRMDSDVIEWKNTDIQTNDLIGLWVQSIVKWIFYMLGQLNLLVIWFITCFQIEKHRQGRWWWWWWSHYSVWSTYSLPGGARPLTSLCDSAGGAGICAGGGETEQVGLWKNRLLCFLWLLLCSVWR